MPSYVDRRSRPDAVEWTAQGLPHPASSGLSQAAPVSSAPIRPPHSSPPALEPDPDCPAPPEGRRPPARGEAFGPQIRARMGYGTIKDDKHLRCAQGRLPNHRHGRGPARQAGEKKCRGCTLKLRVISECLPPEVSWNGYNRYKLSGICGQVGWWSVRSYFGCDCRCSCSDEEFCGPDQHAAGEVL